MVRNAQYESVVRKIKSHHTFWLLFIDQNLFVLNLKLVTEFIFAENADVLGAHVTDPGLGLDSKVLKGVGFAINHLETWSEADIGLQPANGDFFILEKAITRQHIDLRSPRHKPICRIKKRILTVRQGWSNGDSLGSVGVTAKTRFHFRSEPGEAVKKASEF